MSRNFLIKAFSPLKIVNSKCLHTESLASRLSSLQQQNQLSEMVDAIAEAKRRNETVDLDSFKPLLEACKSLGDAKTAKSLLKVVERQFGNIPLDMEIAYLKACMIQTQERPEQIHQTIQLANKIFENDSELTRQVKKEFGFYLFQFGEKEQNLAHELLQQFQSSAMDTQTIRLLMQAYGRKGNHKAIDSLLHYQNDPPCELLVEAWKAHLQACHGKWDTHAHARCDELYGIIATRCDGIDEIVDGLVAYMNLLSQRRCLIPLVALHLWSTNLSKSETSRIALESAYIKSLVQILDMDRLEPSLPGGSIFPALENRPLPSIEATIRQFITKVTPKIASYDSDTITCLLKLNSMVEPPSDTVLTNTLNAIQILQDSGRALRREDYLVLLEAWGTLDIEHLKSNPQVGLNGALQVLQHFPYERDAQVFARLIHACMPVDPFSQYPLIFPKGDEVDKRLHAILGNMVEEDVPHSIESLCALIDCWMASKTNRKAQLVLDEARGLGVKMDDLYSTFLKWSVTPRTAQYALDEIWPDMIRDGVVFSAQDYERLFLCAWKAQDYFAALKLWEQAEESIKEAKSMKIWNDRLATFLNQHCLSRMLQAATLCFEMGKNYTFPPHTSLDKCLKAIQGYIDRDHTLFSSTSHRLPQSQSNIDNLIQSLSSENDMEKRLSRVKQHIEWKSRTLQDLPHDPISPLADLLYPWTRSLQGKQRGAWNFPTIELLSQQSKQRKKILLQNEIQDLTTWLQYQEVRLKR